MPLHINIFLLLFGGLQGLLLILFWVRRKMYQYGYIFLLLYFAAILFQVAMKVMSKLWLMQNWGTVYQVSYFLPVVYGPLVLLFTEQVLWHRKFRIIKLLHFLPFAFFLAYEIANTVSSLDAAAIDLLYRRDVQLVIQLTSLLIYHILSLQCWIKYRNSLKTYFSDTQRLQMKWIQQFVVVSFVVCAVISIAIYLIYVNHPRSGPYRYLFAVLTVFIYWVSYIALTKPAVFSIVKGYAGDENAVLPVLPSLVVHRPAKKYSNSGLTKEEQSNILDLLQREMHDNKPYLNPELTINELAARAKCNRHHLSQALNDSLRQSFYEYVNYYRVEEARHLLTDPSREDHKISSIAYDAGFNSLSTFNDVFKKITGITPSQYKKHPGQLPAQQRV